MDIAANEATTNGNLKKHLHAHHSDHPIIDAKIVAKDATRNSDFHSDEHHSDPPERVFNEVKLCSNLTNPCFALALDPRCYQYLVPWTGMIWLFKLWMGVNLYYTPRKLFHKWKIKIGVTSMQEHRSSSPLMHLLINGDEMKLRCSNSTPVTSTYWPSLDVPNIAYQSKPLKMKFGQLCFMEILMYLKLREPKAQLIFMW